MTRFVAQNFKDYRGIDWQKIVSQHKEFAGHTSTSLRQIYHKVIKLYKEKSTIVTVEEVAAFAEKVYQPGKEKKELASQVVRREKAVQHFKKKSEGAWNIGHYLDIEWPSVLSRKCNC